MINERYCILCSFHKGCFDAMCCNCKASTHYKKKVSIGNCPHYQSDFHFRDLEAAFQNAIEKGMNHPENWMYMYSDRHHDYFKHDVTRNYVVYRFSSWMDDLKSSGLFLIRKFGIKERRTHHG